MRRFADIKKRDFQVSKRIFNILNILYNTMPAYALTFNSLVFSELNAAYLHVFLNL